MDMKKKIIMLIIILVPIFVLSSNKTFLKEYYYINADSKIKIADYSFYLNDRNNTVAFITIKSVEDIRSEMSSYIESLESCYDESYFYDEVNKVTIKSFDIEEGKLFNTYKIDYDLNNLCENEYVLGNSWLNEFKDNAEIAEITVTECIDKCNSKNINDLNLENLLNYLSEDDYQRIENKNNINFDSTSGYYVTAYYTIEDMDYMMYVFSYENNLAIKIIDSNDYPKNALYQLNIDNININELIKNIYDLN